MTERRPVFRTLVYAAVLIWINFYICRDLFFAENTGHMNAMHGFWISMSRLASHHWWRPGWWPYWDAGVPFESTYAPLIPALTALWSGITGASLWRAFYSLSGLTYILTPVALFAMCATLTRSAGWSFIAAMLYSLLSPTQWIVPDEAFTWSGILGARRLYLNVAWDELPHLVSLTALPPMLLFMVLALQRRCFGYALASGAFLCIALLANAFGLTMSALAVFCLLLALGREQWLRNSVWAASIGLGAYLVACPFLPPSLFPAISRNQQFHNAVQYGPGSLTAGAVILLGCAVLWTIFERRQTDWWLRFAGYFAWVTTAIPVLAMYFGRSFLPQPGRYNMEMEMALSVCAAFYAKPLFMRVPPAIRVGLALMFLSLAAEQVVSHRKFEKVITMPVEASSSIEYRVTQWACQNLPSGRIWLPGTLGKWFNVWSDGAQMTGGSWSTAYNGVHQVISTQLVYATTANDLANVYAWLKAYGVHAFAIPGKKSPEFWKPIAHPELFEGCELLWNEDDTRICRVPGATDAGAHVVPRGAMVSHAPGDWKDAGEVRRYAAALDAAQHARLQWTGTGHVQVRTTMKADDALSLQITHHPGWSATVNGTPVEIGKDGLGLMWLLPACQGACDVRLDYSGGFELQACRWVSILTLLGLAIYSVSFFRRKVPASSSSKA